MVAIRITFAADGRSDRSLIHPLRWAVANALRARGAQTFVEFAFAEVHPTPLEQRLRHALDLYPCHLLLIHRDAENEDPEVRHREIDRAAVSAAGDIARVSVIPVRMSEAWLLIDEPSIRIAAGHPSGRVPLELPPVSGLESTADPKRVLREAILAASEARGRRRARLQRDLPVRILRVAELIEDYSPLRRLSAFRRFEAELGQVLDDHLSEWTSD